MMRIYTPSMLPWRFFVLNLIGGTAILASYAYGFALLGDDVTRAWGEMPQFLQRWYVRWMFLAAAGYFPMTAFVLLHESAPGRTRVFEFLYAGIIFGSAAWMPLTALMIQTPDRWLWLLIRLDLALVGACSLAVLAFLLADGPRGRPGWWTLAVAGAAVFCVQTTVLDAFVWPAYFG